MYRPYSEEVLQCFVMINAKPFVVTTYALNFFPIQWFKKIIEIHLPHGNVDAKYSRTSMARTSLGPWGGRVVRRCCVSYITGASN